MTNRGQASVAGCVAVAAPMFPGFRFVALTALFLVAGRPATVGSQTPSPLPADLERYLASEVRPTAGERATLLSGAPLTKLLPADESKEVFVFGAIWINAETSKYVARINDIENFEKGGAFRISKKINDPPTLEDFADLELPADDIRDLRDCKVGDCEVKLSAKALQAMRSQVRWRTPTEKSDVNATFRGLAFEYVTGYREGGNARLAVYRDADDPIFVANEFRSMIERTPSLVGMPDLQRYLLEYPSARLSGASEFLYWQEAPVRTEAHHPDQSPDRAGPARPDGDRIEDAVRVALLLDGFRTAGAPARSCQGTRILVRDDQPQPIRWPQGLHRTADSRTGSKRSGERHPRCTEGDKGQPRTAVRPPVCPDSTELPT